MSPQNHELPKAEATGQNLTMTPDEQKLPLLYRAKLCEQDTHITSLHMSASAEQHSAHCFEVQVLVGQSKQRVPLQNMLIYS